MNESQGILGSDPYICPEQLRGRTDEVGPASDVYSLGVILYELVAGRRPFEGETSEETRDLIKCDEPPPPIRLFRSKTPRDLETIIGRCLRKTIVDRYGSAQELADDLQRWLNGEPIHARPISVWHRIWKYAKRKPLVVALCSVVVLGGMLVTGLVGAWISDRMSAADEIASAKAATAVAEGIERQHHYVSNIQYAAESLRKGRRREVLELLQQCQSLAQEPVHCGIEWDVLWSEVNGADRNISAHPGGVYCARYAPGGELFVSAGKDGRVILWETTNWRARWEFDDQLGDVNVVDFSADGSLIAFGGDDGRVIVRSAKDGSKVYDEKVVNGRVFDLTWLGRASRFAVGGEDAVLSIIDPLTRECRRNGPLAAIPPVVPGQEVLPNEISCVAYIPQLDAIAVGMAQRGIHLVSISSMADVGPTIDERYGIGAMCHVSIDDGYLAVSGGGPSIRLWSVKDGAKRAEFPVDHYVRMLRFSQATNTLAAGFRGGIVETWNVVGILANGKLRGHRICAHSGRASTVDFSPNGQTLVSGGEDGYLRQWRGNAITSSFDLPLPEKVWASKLSPCDRWLATVEGKLGSPGSATVFDARSGAQLWSNKVLTGGLEMPHFSYVGQEEIDFAPSGDELAALCADFVIRGYDPQTGRVLKSYKLPTDRPMQSLQFSPDGRYLIAKRPFDETFIADRTSGDVIARYSGVNYVGLFRTKRGDVWLENQRGGECLLRPTPSSQPTVVLSRVSSRLISAAVSNDGRYLAAGGHDPLVYFWDLDHPGSARKLVGHAGEIIALQFSPDGRALLSHSEDGTVRLWDLATRSMLLSFGSARERVTCLGLNASGNLLVFGIECEGRFGVRVFPLGQNRASLPPRWQSVLDVPNTQGH